MIFFFFTEQIVMTPKGRTANETTLIIERRAVAVQNNSNNDKTHVAGGDHQGIIINKFIATGICCDLLLVIMFQNYC